MAGPWKHWQGRIIEGQFRLERYLGSGPRSGVFLTRLGEGKRRAAVKLLPTQPEDAGVRLSRWVSVCKLCHPGLLAIKHVGNCELGGEPMLYAVMEYAPENLAGVLARRSLSGREAREMLEAVLEALAYVHENGFVHGRIKPSNILAIGNQVKISIDGLQPAGERCAPARPGGYDPPERAAGEMSPAGDVWSLGMTLVSALTRRVFAGGAPGHRNPALPEALAPLFVDIIRHSLEADPRQRITVAGLAARLREVPPAPRPSPTVRRVLAFPDWRHIIPAAACSAALGAVLAAPGLLHRTVPAVQVQLASVQPPQSERGAEKQLEADHSADRLATEKEESAIAPRAHQVVHRVLPDIPRKARDTIDGTVRVSVRALVAPSGRVVSAKLASPGPSRYFAALTLEAARRWRFEPIETADPSLSREWVLRFEYTRTGTRVHPVRVGQP